MEPITSLYSTLLAVLLCTTAVIGQECSSQGIEPLISGTEVYKLASHLITASSSLNASHSPEEVRLQRGAGWCSQELGLDVLDPWIEFNFGVDVVIYNITIAGNSIGHVNEFRIQFTTMENANLQFVMQTDPTTPEIFNISEANGELATTQLPTPLVAQRLRLLPYSWPENPPCLQAEVYGCILNPVCETEVNLYNSTDALTSVTFSTSTMINEWPVQLFRSNEYFCFGFNSSEPPPSVSLNFSWPVTLTRAVTLYPIDIAGETTYVNSYTLETSEDGVVFAPYMDASGTMEILTDIVTRFWIPVAVPQYLRLNITDAHMALGTVCWHLDLFGCLSNQAVGVPTTRAPFSATPAPAPERTPLPTPSEAPVEETVVTPLPSPPHAPVEEIVVTQKDYLVLRIGLPLAVGTIFIEVLVCVVGVAICVHLKRTAEYKLRLLSPPEQSPAVRYRPAQLQPNANNTAGMNKTIRVFHNALYNSQEGSLDDQNTHNLAYETVSLTVDGSTSIPIEAANYETAVPSNPASLQHPRKECGHIMLAAVQSSEPLELSLVSHDYESVRLSRGSTTPVERPPSSEREVLPSGRPVAAEYEFMESTRRNDSPSSQARPQATNPHYVNVPHVEVQQADLSLSETA